MKRYGLFVDGSNFFVSAKAAGFRVDFTKILNYYKEMGEVSQSFYFTALPPRDVESPLRRLVDYVRYNGFKVIEKETKSYVDPVSNEAKLKGNMDVEIAVYANEVAQTITHMVLFSGDGDFCCLVESLQRRYNVHCTVVSARGMVANNLRATANEFVDLVSMKGKWTHESKVELPRKKFTLIP